MRILPIAAAFAVAVLSTGIGQTQAAPVSLAPAPAAAREALVAVQLVCNPSRCIDPRNGAYTQSGCNRRGCYPISGVMGYTNPNGGYGSDYPHRRWERYRGGEYGWGR